MKAHSLLTLLILCTTVEVFSAPLCEQALKAGTARPHPAGNKTLQTFYGYRLQPPRPGIPMRIFGESTMTVTNNSSHPQNPHNDNSFDLIPTPSMKESAKRFPYLGKAKEAAQLSPTEPLTGEEQALYQSLYPSVFERFRLSTWNLENFSNDRTRAPRIARVLSVVRPHVLAVQELLSEDAAVRFAQEELLGLYEPILMPHSRNHHVSQVGFFVLKNLPFDLSVKSYYNNARLDAKRAGNKEPLFLHDLLILSFYPRGLNQQTPLFSIMNLHLKSPARALMNAASNERHEAFSHTEDEAIPQILAAFQKQYPEVPLFIVGDTNREFSDSDLGRKLSTMGWSSDDGVSTLINKDLKPIDVTLAPTTVSVIGRSTLGDGVSKTQWPSDHKIKNIEFRLTDLLHRSVESP